MLCREPLTSEISYSEGLTLSSHRLSIKRWSRKVGVEALELSVLFLAHPTDAIIL